ncbi:DUF2987 domain-containing protein [Oceanisphaera pacifica]|uniref:DUF2987 domain-containing protein n=1 Tax=Oceanisphaera pacifica TaxID=2818389 RepID=A0ABS3NFT8_9GAMM|nr:DUF2987 domain-containing protein [Oceanisphaera pacifica]MBO1519449.1 DUF2987 domain-containing protein [Oceanisphaera pacifica]
MKHSFIIAMLLALPSSQLQAAPLELGYSGFFKYMAKVKKSKVEHADLGFYLSRTDGQGLCQIESGVVTVDDEIRGEVEVLPHQQFLLPKDKDLDLDKAIVALEMAGTTECDISIQIQSNLEGGDVTHTDLRAVEQDMYVLLQKMAGWPGKYFVPELQGITLTPAMPGQDINGQSQLKLSQAQLAEEGSFNLPAVRITPWF